MKLGVVWTCYMRLFGPPRFYDDGTPRPSPTPWSPIFVPYPEIKGPEPGEDALEWLICRSHERGLTVLGDPVRRWQEPGYVARIADLAYELGVEIQANWSTTYLYPPEKRAPVDAFVHYLRQCCKPLGVTIVGTANSPMEWHRWRKDPPLDEQLELIAEGIRPYAEAAAAEGITLAFENHTDYRAAEVVRIIERANVPSLKVRYDTGNQFLVTEEPVDAARILAPYTAAVHLKDMWVINFCLEGGKIFGALLGKGHVDNRAILEILRRDAPGGTDLPCLIELSFIPTSEDPVEWTELSIDYCQRELAEFFPTPRAGR